MEENERERDEETLARREKSAATYGTIGRCACALFFILMCVALGVGELALQIAGVAVFAVVLVAYIASVLVVTKKLDALRAKLRGETPYEPTEMFAALAEEFDRDDLKEWADTVRCKSKRAFRDDVTLEVEFTLDGGTTLSAVFENEQVRLLVDDREEGAYRLPYTACEKKEDVFNALSAAIDGIRNEIEGNRK